MMVLVSYTCPQVPKCLQKCDKSGYEADDDNRNPSAETDLKKDDCIETPPVLLSEPPAKKFRRSLRNKQTALNYNEDPYNAEDDFFLEKTE